MEIELPPSPQITRHHKQRRHVTIKLQKVAFTIVLLIILVILAFSVTYILSRHTGGDVWRSGSVRRKHETLHDDALLADDDDHNANVAMNMIEQVTSMIGSENDTESLSIVCQLSGELGNNIAKFVHAYVLWLKLTRAAQNTDSNVKYHIILRHQLHSKWVRARDDAKLCFSSSLGRFDFTRGNQPDFDVLLEQQVTLKYMELFRGVNTDPHQVQGALDNFTRIAALERQNNRNNINSSSSNSPFISLPFLLSETMVGHPTFVEFVDEFYYKIRTFLRFDREACCALTPYPDESVFHHRNFVTEMPRVGVRLGFEEMGPHQTARDLFGHLNAGDKVAIVSRFERSKHEEQFIDALERRGLLVRFVQGQTGVQDFCFLMSAKKELIGPGLSTFFFWSGILGNAKRVRSYWLDTNETRAQNGGNFRVDYVWKNAELRDRFKFELYSINRDLNRQRWLSLERQL